MEKITGKNVLHIAPETHFKNIIKSYVPNNYICGDLHPTSSDIIEMDIININYPDEYFDFIICNHVLEHIKDDIKAMKELYRVLKKDSYAILQTPFSPIIENSFENDTIITDEQRLKFYGQKDHVRIYGLDLFKKLESIGFELHIVKNSDLFSNEECLKYGVNFKKDLIMVYKK